MVFNVINASRLAELSVPSSSKSSWAILLSVEVMLLVTCWFDFLCAFITFLLTRIK